MSNPNNQIAGVPEWALQVAHKIINTSSPTSETASIHLLGAMIAEAASQELKDLVKWKEEATQVLLGAGMATGKAHLRINTLERYIDALEGTSDLSTVAHARKVVPQLSGLKEI